MRKTVDVEAAVLLRAPGELQFVASSSESMTVLEFFQIQADEGPCVDCYRDGTGDHQPRADRIGRSVAALSSRRAMALGFRAVHCLPDAPSRKDDWRAQPLSNSPGHSR